MVGKKCAVAEIVFAERRRLEHAAQLVELFQTVAAGPGESPHRPQLACEPIDFQATTARLSGTTGIRCTSTWPAAFAAALVQQHELERVKKSEV